MNGPIGSFIRRRKTALSRWKDGQFLEAERESAKAWREALKAIDLEAVYRQFKPLVDVVEKPRTANGAGKSRRKQLV